MTNEDLYIEVERLVEAVSELSTRVCFNYEGIRDPKCNGFVLSSMHVLGWLEATKASLKGLQGTVQFCHTWQQETRNSKVQVGKEDVGVDGDDQRVAGDGT